jgi:hypothetical protein
VTSLFFFPGRCRRKCCQKQISGCLPDVCCLIESGCRCCCCLGRFSRNCAGHRHGGSTKTKSSSCQRRTRPDDCSTSRRETPSGGFDRIQARHQRQSHSHDQGCRSTDPAGRLCCCPKPYSGRCQGCPPGCSPNPDPSSCCCCCCCPDPDPDLDPSSCCCCCCEHSTGDLAAPSVVAPALAGGKAAKQYGQLGLWRPYQARGRQRV